MDMSKLRDSLPPGGRGDAERDLNNDFKAAALSITKLYKASLKASNDAYSAGYAAALTELLEKCASNLSTGMSLQEVKDWARARIDALQPNDLSEEERKEERREEERRSSSEREDGGVARRRREREASKASTVTDGASSKPTSAEGRSRTTSTTAGYNDTTNEADSHSRRSPNIFRMSSPQRQSPSPRLSNQSTPIASMPKRRANKPVGHNNPPLRDTPLNAHGFPTSPTFAPSLPAAVDFPFFPASMFHVEPPVAVPLAPFGQTQTGSLKRRHDALVENEVSGGAGRQPGSGGSRKRHQRERERGGQRPPRDDPMDEDDDRERKRRR